MKEFLVTVGSQNPSSQDNTHNTNENQMTSMVPAQSNTSPLSNEEKLKQIEKETKEKVEITINRVLDNYHEIIPCSKIESSDFSNYHNLKIKVGQ